MVSRMQGLLADPASGAAGAPAGTGRLRLVLAAAALKLAGLDRGDHLPGVAKEVADEVARGLPTLGFSKGKAAADMLLAVVGGSANAYAALQGRIRGSASKKNPLRDNWTSPDGRHEVRAWQRALLLEGVPTVGHGIGGAERRARTPQELLASEAYASFADPCVQAGVTRHVISSCPKFNIKLLGSSVQVVLDHGGGGGASDERTAPEQRTVREILRMLGDGYGDGGNEDEKDCEDDPIEWSASMQHTKLPHPEAGGILGVQFPCVFLRLTDDRVGVWSATSRLGG